MMNLKLKTNDHSFYRPHLLKGAAIEVPAHFSWRELTPKCMVPVVD